MRRSSAPKVIVCFTCVQVKVSERRRVWLRTRDGIGSLIPERFEKLMMGMPKSTGESDTPVIPKLAAISVPNELLLRISMRLRLQFKCMLSTRRGDQL